MKKGTLKKIFASFLALTMMVTMVPTAYASTEETTESVVEETTEPVVEEMTEPVVEETTEPVVEKENTDVIVEEVVTVSIEDENPIAVASADVTPPVVESLTSDINGKTITYGESVSFTIYAYDAESELSAEKSKVNIFAKNGSIGFELSATIVKGENENEYTLSFTPTQAGEWVIMNIGIADVYGNCTYTSFNGEYIFTVENAKNEDVTVSDIVLSSEILELTDNVLNSSIEVTLNTTGIDESSIVKVKYTTSDEQANLYNKELTGWLYYQDGAYKGQITAGYYNVAGTYVLEGVYVNEERVNCSETSQFRLVKNNTDKIAPVINEVKLLDQNGNEIQYGDIIATTDVLTVRVKVTDSSEIGNVIVSFTPMLDTVAEKYKWIHCQYDGSGYYVGTINATEYYPTAWVINAVQAWDIYQNERIKASFNIGFCVQDSEGTCLIPTITTDLWFSQDGWYHESYTVTTPVITSLQEMFPNGVPQPPVYEGCTFLGWQIEGQDNIISETDRLLLPSSDVICINPVYDKVPVVVNFETLYNGTFESREENNIVVVVESGITLGEAYNQIKNSDAFKNAVANLKHDEGLQLEGWELREYYETESEQIINSLVAMTIRADYDKVPVAINTWYFNEEGRDTYDVEYLFVEEGTTYAELQSKLSEPKVTHAASLGNITGWQFECLPQYDMTDVVTNGTNIYYTATYEKKGIDVAYVYYDKNGKKQTVEEFLVVDEGTTYQDVLDKYLPIVESVEHDTSLGFIEWKHYISGFNDNEEISGIAYLEFSARYTTYPSEEDKEDKEDDVQDEIVKDEESNNGDASIYYPIVTPSTPVVETVKAETTTKTENNRNSIAEVEDAVETKPIVKLETKVIAEKVEEITQAEEGSTFIVEMKKEDGTVATEVPVEILEAVKGRDVEITLDMGDYSWTINGKDVLASELSAINLEVTLDTQAVAPSIVDALAGGEPTRQLSLTHNGDFGFKASLSINVGSEHEGEFGNLYYHDSNGKLVFMNAGQIDADGNVSLDFSHASDYVVVVGRDRTEEETIATNTDTEVQDNVSETTGVVNDSESGLPVSLIVIVVVFIIAIVVIKNKKK